MPDSSDPRDELLSRHLDGDLSAEERARLDADPTAGARLDQLRAAAQLVGTPPPIPTEALDRIRATVLEQSATTEQVTSLSAARAERLQRRTRILAVAAAFVFLALGARVLVSSGGQDDDTAGESADMATATDDGADASDAGDDSARDAMEESAVADAEAGMDTADSAASGLDPSGDAAADEALDDGAARDPAPFPLDRLPDDLGPVADLGRLAEMLTELDAIAIETATFADVELDPFLAFGERCPALTDAIAAAQPDGTVFVEFATVALGAAASPAEVAVATGADGTVIAFLIADDTCLDVVEIDAPLG